MEKMYIIVSAFGSAGNSEKPYRAAIRCDRTEIEEALHGFLMSEIKRVKGDPEIMEDIEELDREEAEASVKQVLEENRELISQVSAFHLEDVVVLPMIQWLTDYHVEFYRPAENETSLADAQQVVILYSYDAECCGQSEFPTIQQLIDTRDETGTPDAEQYSDLCGEPVGATTSQKWKELIGETQTLDVLTHKG